MYNVGMCVCVCWRCDSSKNWTRTLHVSDRFSAHRQESSTVHTAIGLCHTDLLTA